MAVEPRFARAGLVGVAPDERLLLYATALQTGLRASELRALTPGQCDPTGSKPYIRIRARSTKNRKDAQQYLTPELATALRAHLARKAPAAPVFHMPPEDQLAEMFRADVASARQSWLRAAEHNPQEWARREKSDFLMPSNGDREQLDFHALRHTTGAWAAMGGAHPKAVQPLLRHAGITRTMDTYGHLFPGQDAKTVHRLPPLGLAPEPARATGPIGLTG